MDIIKELWYGNVAPFEQCTRGDKQMKELLSLMARNRDELGEGLTEKQKETLEKFEEALNEMHSIAEQERHRIANMPVEDYLYEWLDGHKRNVSKTTYDGYKKNIDLRIVPFFKELNLKVNEVTGDEINQFYEKLTDEGLKGTSMQRYHSVLHLAFKSAFKRRILPANPVDQADRPKAQQYIADYYNPDYVSEHFAVLLKRHGLRKIRFHDLRHSCASTMLALGKQMKDIQMWLGHSDMSTTANIYSHIDSTSKNETAQAIGELLG